MNRFMTAAFLSVTLAGPALAQNVPLPPARPYVNVGYATSTYQVVRPNGRVAQCEVTRHFEPGRGTVRTRSCWRIR